MQAESLEVLEKASVAPAQARAIVRAIEIEIARAPETLAPKNALSVLAVDLRGELAALRAEIAKQGSWSTVRCVHTLGPGDRQVDGRSDRNRPKNGRPRDRPQS